MVSGLEGTKGRVRGFRGDLSYPFSGFLSQAFLIFPFSNSTSAVFFPFFFLWVSSHPHGHDDDGHDACWQLLDASPFPFLLYSSSSYVTTTTIGTFGISSHVLMFESSSGCFSFSLFGSFSFYGYSVTFFILTFILFLIIISVIHVGFEFGCFVVSFIVRVRFRSVRSFARTIRYGAAEIIR